MIKDTLVSKPTVGDEYRKDLIAIDRKLKMAKGT